MTYNEYMQAVDKRDSAPKLVYHSKLEKVEYDRFFNCFVIHAQRKVIPVENFLRWSSHQ